METRQYTILCLLMLLFLTGCNGDIFVEDFLPGEQREISLTETGNSVEINFKSDNWALNNLFGEFFNQFDMNVSTIDGKRGKLPLKEKELGIIHYKSDYIDVVVEKNNASHLKFTLNENLMNERVEMMLIVSNDISVKNMKVMLSPTQKYRLDSVVYDWDNFKSHENSLKQVDSKFINNQGSTPITFIVFPYREATCEVDFYDTSEQWDENMFDKLFGQPLPEITIPEVINGKPVLQNTKVAFGIRHQQLETTLDKNVSVDVTINGFTKRNVVVYNVVRWYSVPYKVYISNSKTDKKRVFSGELRCEIPIDYLILKRVWD